MIPTDLIGILPAPEASHAIKVVIDEALACKKSGQAKTIVLRLSGHGHFDLGAYDEYFCGKLQDYEYPKEKVAEALAKLPKVSFKRGPEGMEAHRLQTLSARRFD